MIVIIIRIDRQRISKSNIILCNIEQQNKFSEVTLRGGANCSPVATCCCYELTFSKKIDEIPIAHDLRECERKMVVLKYQQEYTDDIMIALEIAMC